MSLDLSDYPRFSLAERDRRWGRVRELMRERSCDCLVAPGARDAEHQSPSRYLSQIGGTGSAWVIFPLEGEPTAILDSDRNQQFFGRTQDWISDLRTGSASEAVPARLKELELDGARIGFVLLEGHYRASDGIIPHETMRKIKEALPRAQIYGENHVLNHARVVKGPEEIVVVERVTAANDEAIRVMCERSRPGVRQEEVWYAMNDVLTRASMGPPARLSVTFDGPANLTLGTPIPDRVRQGALCSQEICARIQGYRAQCNHTIQVGDGEPRDYRDAMLKTIEVYNEMVAWAKPGVTVGAFCEHYVDLCRARGAEDSSGVMFHTNGLGDDYPRLGPRLRFGDEQSLVLQPGFSFTLKPVLKLPSGTTTQYGEPMTITDRGARRLGRRAQEPILVRRS